MEDLKDKMTDKCQKPADKNSCCKQQTKKQEQKDQKQSGKNRCGCEK